VLLVGASEHDHLVQCRGLLESHICVQRFLVAGGEQLHLLVLGAAVITTRERHEAIAEFFNRAIATEQSQGPERAGRPKRVDELDEALPRRNGTIELEAMKPGLGVVQQMERCVGDSYAPASCTHGNRAIEFGEVQFVIGGQEIAAAAGGDEMAWP
jgi:hypothetical protein